MLAGCQSETERVQHWIGQTSQNLLTVWGNPTKSIEDKATGSSILIFTRKGFTYKQPGKIIHHPVSYQPGLVYPSETIIEEAETKTYFNDYHFLINSEGIILQAYARSYSLVQ